MISRNNKRVISRLLLVLLMFATVLPGCSAEYAQDQQEQFLNMDEIDYSAGVAYYKNTPPELIMEKDISYDFGLKLDICYPRPQENITYPLIVYIHGGGWASGTKSDIEPVMSSVAMKGYVIATVEYTFTDRETFPAQLRDIRNAIQYLLSNEEQYGIDSSSVGLWGISAGAHLALLTAYTSESDIPTQWNDEFQISAVSSWSGPTDFLIPVTPAGVVFNFLGVTGLEGNEEQFVYASPVSYVNSFSPPTQILHGWADEVVAPENAQRLADLLDENGCVYELAVYENQGHPLNGEEYLNDMLFFFHRHLKDVD